MTYTIDEASNKLPALLEAVKDGQQVTICGQDGQPAADLVPAKAETKGERKFGTMKGRIKVLDPNWHVGPQTDAELEAWLKGEFE
jgi:prevent-host-death family protein